jgi:uncharacterized protein YidB (DUF937 family)
MGIFSDLVSAATGSALQGGQGGAQAILTNVLEGSSLGGVSGLVNQISGAGLGHLVDSWTGSGQGMPISVGQLKCALTLDHIQEIASALHMDPDSALSHLAEHLPMLAGKLA